MPEKIKAFLTDDSPALREALRPYEDRIEVITVAQVAQQPNLLGQIEIAYGWLNEGQLARAPHLRWLQTGGAGVEGLIPARSIPFPSSMTKYSRTLRCSSLIGTITAVIFLAPAVTAFSIRLIMEWDGA